jgi:Ser/Thr protein kinase RdoA (MazF antagonist)
MKITKKEAEQISNFYNLGSIKKIKVIPGGWVNHNFNFITNKGSFIIRVLGKKFNKSKREQLILEFKVLQYLNENKFPYNIPVPIKNNRGESIVKINGKTVWVYRKLNGRVMKNLNSIQLKEMVRALAIYHKSVKNFKLDSSVEKNEARGLKQKFILMEKIKPKDNIDLLMLNNIAMIKNLFEKVKNRRFVKNLLPVHLDFHKNNLLYSRNKVIGILDFENIRIAPRIRDIAYLIKTTVAYGKSRFSKRVNFIIKEYDKINPLEKNEKTDILLILARDSCIMFDYFYHTREDIISDGEYWCLKWTINVAKQIVNVLERDR